MYHSMSLTACLVFLSLRSGLVQFSRCFLSMILFWIFMISFTRSSVVRFRLATLSLFTSAGQLRIACHLHSSHGMNLNTSGINSSASYGVFV